MICQALTNDVTRYILAAEGDAACQAPATVVLVTRDHGANESDKVLQALERDAPDDPLHEAQTIVQVCDEHAALILCGNPFLKQIEVETTR